MVSEQKEKKGKKMEKIVALVSEKLEPVLASMTTFIIDGILLAESNDVLPAKLDDFYNICCSSTPLDFSCCWKKLPSFFALGFLPIAIVRFLSHCCCPCLSTSPILLVYNVAWSLFELGRCSLFSLFQIRYFIIFYLDLIFYCVLLF